MATFKKENVTLNWNGDALIRKKNKVTATAINETVTETIKEALDNHPEWQYQTGVAENSINQKQFAKPNKLVALWGSIWTALNESNYVWFLEFNHGSFLRKAADKIYPSLVKRIKKRFK